MNTKTSHKVILLFGPTGVGKTDLVDRLFAGRGEIISADSMQVYRRMDIGTAKPSGDLLERLPHHLIDIIDPDKQFHTGEFTRRSERLIGEISSRGKIPVISGGTAFYYRNFLFGMPETPAAEPEVRERLARRMAEEGSAVLYKELSSVDQVSASRIPPGDTYRILRALEVFHSSGRPLSSFSVPSRIRDDLKMLFIGLDRDRSELYGRIDSRVGVMFEEGLFPEFRSLVEAGYGPGDPGMQGIGYGEFFRMVREPCISLEGVKNLIRRNSRHYAKRQMTFFRKIPGVRWFHPENEKEKILREVEEFLSD